MSNTRHPKRTKWHISFMEVSKEALPDMSRRERREWIQANKQKLRFEKAKYLREKTEAQEGGESVA